MLVHAPLVADKRAICWLDVLLFAIFVTAGLWLWNVADRAVSEEYREQKPIKETYEHQANVTLLQARLTMAQEDLKIQQNKLFELRMEATRLAAELALRTQHARAQLLSREQRSKLLTTQAVVGAYEAQLPEKLKQVASAANSTFLARRSAELAYDKATRAFEYANKIRVLAFGSALSLILALAIWFICRALCKRLGHGSAAHVLLPGSILIVLASIYYVAK